MNDERNTKYIPYVLDGIHFTLFRDTMDVFKYIICSCLDSIRKLYTLMSFIVHIR